MHYARKGIVTPEMEFVALRESMLLERLYRRITAELRRRGMQVNHKRVVRIMRKDNLLALQPKRFKVTRDSNHKLEIYLNLALG